MWVLERPDGGRGFGFTGGHTHETWGDPNQRKLFLNALLWLAKSEIPAGGVESKVVETDLGEYILQLAKEPPSHIVAPVVHKVKDEVSDLFAQKHSRPRQTG